MALVDPNTRQAKRTPVTLKIKFKSATLEEFIERYAVDVSHGGIFIRTKEPLAVGTSMKFEFQLKDATPLIHGEGTVVWTRENDPARPGVAPGMGVRFDRLGEGSQAVLDRILAQKAKSGSAGASTVDPKVFEQPTRAFNEAPTKVAPSPLVGQLAADARAGRATGQPFGPPAFGSLSPPKSGFQDERTDATPLPNPVPFHSDADEFPDEAFEEATKVRSVEELVAQTAKGNEEAAKAAAAGAQAGGKPVEKPIDKAIVDELAARRAAREKEEAAAAKAEPVKGEAAKVEVAPSAKAEVAKPDTKKDAKAAVKADAKAAKADAKSDAAKEKAAKAEVKPEIDRTAERAARAAERAARREAATTAPAKVLPGKVATPVARADERRSSALPALFVVVLLAGAAAAAYFFWYKPSQETAPEQGTTAASGTAAASGSAVASGTDVATGSGATTGTAAAAITPDAAPVVEAKPVTINAPKGATVEIVGTDQKGAAPFTAKLDPSKTFTARVTAPGQVPQDVEVQGGSEPVTVKLSAMPSVLRVASQPAGASIYIDGQATGKTTPADIKLSASQASASKLKVTMRRQGFDRFEAVIKKAAFQDGGEQLVAEVSGTLKKSTSSGKTGGGKTGGGSTAGGATPGGGATTGTGAGSGATTGTGAGSGATTGTGAGSGATTGTGGTTGGGTTGGGAGSGATTGTGAGSGSATKPPAGTGSGSATKPPAGSGSGSAEPTPDWAK